MMNRIYRMKNLAKWTCVSIQRRFSNSHLSSNKLRCGVALRLARIATDTHTGIELRSSITKCCLMQYSRRKSTGDRNTEQVDVDQFRY